MKKLLVAMFVALLMVGCGGDGKSGSDSPESNQSSGEVTKIDLDDPETRKRIIAEAIDGKKLQVRGKEGEKLAYAPDEQNPYSGWTKKMHDTDWLPQPIESLWQFKDGKPDGHVISWHENGQKKGETTFKGGKKYGLETFWYENGQKEFEGNNKDGGRDGLWTYWYEDGQKQSESNYKDGKHNGLWKDWYEDGQKESESTFKDDKRDGLMTGWYKNGQKKEEAIYKDGKVMTVVQWKPNGDKCPHTNVVNGNGVVFFYSEDAPGYPRRYTYKDGEVVR